MRGTLAHQVGQEIHVIFSKCPDLLLLCAVVGGTDDLIHPPFIAGSCTEHTSHQMIMSVCMCKGMQRIVLIYTKFLRRDKDGSACSKGDIAHTISNSSGSYCCCGIVTCAGCHLYCLRNTKLPCDLWLYCAYAFIAFIKLWQHLLADTTDLTHFL